MFNTINDFIAYNKKSELNSIMDYDSGYTLNIDSKKIGDQEVLYTGGKVKILDSTGKVYKEYTMVVTGDVDGDGTISTKDYILIYNHFDGTENLSGEFAKAGDMNNDGQIKTNDYIQMYNAWKSA